MGEHFSNFLQSIPGGIYALLAALVAILGAFAVQRYIGLRAARTAFRAALNADVAEIANPSRIPDNYVYVHLARRYPLHSAAVLEFSIHLGSRARKRLADDWSAYASSTDEIRQRYDALSGTAEAQACRKLAVERLQKIVSHGSET